MHNLAIDMGNTRIKVGVFSHDQLIKVFDSFELNTLPDIVSTHGTEKVIVSSVVAKHDLKASLQSLDLEVVELTPDLDVPVSNCYDTPKSLGMDRLAGAIGANSLFPGQSCLVIDAGTTITYDFIDEKGSYHGGGISPGIRLRFQSLNQHTHQLPLLEPQTGEVPLVGKDTANSIASGVVNGVLAEIEGIIRRYELKFPTLKVILCGGDAEYFESKLKAPIFVAPHLVLIGLNSVLLYHAEDK